MVNRTVYPEVPPRNFTGRGYFHQLLAANQEIDESLRPLLRLSRDNIVRLRRAEATLLRSLKRDPLLSERVKRLTSLPAVGVT
jgi:transposase